MTLDEVHILEKSTCQQLSAKWKESRIGRLLHRILVRFCYIGHHHQNPLLILSLIYTRQHCTTPAPINHTRQHFTTPAPINHGLQNEIKAYNAYCSKTSFVTHACGLVVNPSLP